MGSHWMCCRSSDELIGSLEWLELVSIPTPPSILMSAPISIDRRSAGIKFVMDEGVPKDSSQEANSMGTSWDWFGNWFGDWPDGCPDDSPSDAFKFSFTLLAISPSSLSNEPRFPGHRDAHAQLSFVNTPLATRWIGGPLASQ